MPQPTGPQFENIDYGDGRYSMKARVGGKTVADVNYNVFGGDDQIDVEWLQSHEEGKGHARRLMQNLYDTYPENTIHWGQIVHPASQNLAEQFSEKYPDRTAYDLDEDF